MKKTLISQCSTKANEHLFFSLVILVASFPFVADHGASGGITKGKIKILRDSKAFKTASLMRSLLNI